MKPILKYTLTNFFIVLISLSAHSQDKKKDSLSPRGDQYGLRVGSDIYKLTKSFYEKDYQGLELVADYRLTKNYFLAAEIGNENKTTDDDRFNFTTKGTYLKVGFDYNSYENWLDMRNLLHLGLRYSASTFSQKINNYKLYNTSTYFQETNPIISGQKFDGLSAQWLEIVGGVKAEVLHNIFVGFSVRINYLISNAKPDNFDNLYIPGFDRTYDGKFGASFNYTISYFLPIYKKKRIANGQEIKK